MKKSIFGLKYVAAAASLILIAMFQTACNSSDPADAQKDYSYVISEGEAVITDYKGLGSETEVPAAITDSSGTYDVTTIVEGVFVGNSSLTSIDIPASVTSISFGTFAGCESLEEINVSKDNGQYSSVDGVLYDKAKTALVCYPMGKEGSSFTVPDGVLSIENWAFSGCSSLKSVEMPNSVTAIGGWAFNGCSGLESMNIPDKVTEIGTSTFNGCTGLKSVDIPDGLTAIGDSAFFGCSSLESVNIPQGVAAIGSGSFGACTGLKTISAYPPSAPTVGMNAFDKVTSDAVLYIQKDAKGYDSEPWSNFQRAEF